MLYDEHIGVLAVGETHLSEEQVEEIENSIYGERLNIYNSIDPEHPNAKGIAIVLNRDITNTEGVSVHYLIPGRAILLVLPWHGKHTVTILAVYAPCDTMASNEKLWNDLHSLWMSENLPVPDLVLGDTNIVEDAIDRLPHHWDDDSATEALARFKRILELKDGWRSTNPDTKAYTYTHPTGSHSRIDRIYVSPDLLKTCRNWTIDDVGTLTDHRMVSVKIFAPKSPHIGRGRYTIPLFLINDKQFLNFASERGIELQECLKLDRTDDTNSQTLLKKYKDEVKQFAQVRAKEAIGALEQKKRKLQRERDEILNDQTEQDDQSQAAKAAHLQAEINNIMNRQRSKKKMDTKIRCRTELDTISPFSVKLSQKAKTRDIMIALKKPNTNPPQFAERSNDMAELARNYHNDVQRDESEDDTAQKNNAPDVVLSEIPPNDSSMEGPLAALSKELTEGEVLKALLDSPNGKAAGVDGIPTELWKKLNTHHTEIKKASDGSSPTFDVVTTLTAIYNDIERHGVAKNTEFAKGWMCPIYKKKDPTDIANYRPITVLNTDYKIFTKALTQKLSDVAPSLIHPNQAGFMKGRRIADQVRLSRMMVEYAEEEI